MSVALEIAVFTIESALLAAEAGADRLELCDNPAEGGTTPSYGMLKIVRKKISIPLFPIIRPRGGDFFFSEMEFETMKKDISLCKELQFDGVVIGCLLQNGHIDTVHTKQLVDLAYPLDVTFHRAFDRAIEPLQALEDIIDCGCNRLLTSGQVPNAFDGKELIKQLVITAGDRIIIMPGSGVRSSNILELAKFTGTKELHSSARINLPSTLIFQQKTMKETMCSVSVDVEEIMKMKSRLTGFSN